MSPSLTAGSPKMHRAPRVSGDEPVGILLAYRILVGAPRVSGDEPETNRTIRNSIKCSPRERG